MQLFAAHWRFTRDKKKFHAPYGTLLKAISGGLLGAALLSHAAMATTCGSYPYTFSNGTTADATQVNSNFSAILSCANTLLAPLDSPTFTTRVQIGTTGSTALFDVNTGSTYTTSGSFLAKIAGTLASSNTAQHTGLLVQPTFNPSSTFASLNALQLVPTISPSLGSNVNVMRGESVQPTIGTGYAGVVTNAYGVDVFDLTPANDLSTTTYEEFRGEPISNGNGATSGTTSNFTFFSSGHTAAAGSGGAVNNYGAYLIVGSGSGAGTTSNYGLRVTGNGGSGGAGTTNNYGIYDDSTATNYFKGSLGIGTTTPAVNLAVVGDIRVGTSGTNGCLQNFAGTALTGTCSSDAALKTVKQNVVGILDKFASLQLVKFYWNKTAASVYHNSTTELNTGFIAQAVQRQFPELVSIDTKGYRQLDYTTLSLYGLEAIKELKTNNDRLKTVNANQARTIAELKSRLDDQERRLAQMQAQLNNLAAANDNRKPKGHLRTAQR